METTTTKTEMLVVRLTPDQKEALRRAAENSGMSLTRFVTGAIEKAVKQAPKEPTWMLPDASGNLSGVARVLKQAEAGGSTGYRWASRMMAFAQNRIARETPRRRARRAAVRRLASFLASLGNTPARQRSANPEILNQIRGEDSVLGVAIPARRVSEFVKGAREAPRGP